MHIVTTRRALMPGGTLVNAGLVLDLPEAEALPLLESGAAEPWPRPDAEVPVAEAPDAEAPVAGAPVAGAPGRPAKDNSGGAPHAPGLVRPQAD